jgi:hypothetical protein
LKPEPTPDIFRLASSQESAGRFSIHFRFSIADCQLMFS